MALALSVAVVMIGSTLLLASVLVVTLAKPDESFPLWGNPRVRRGASIGLRVGGVLLVMLGSLWGIAPVAGFWAIVPVVIAFAPGTVAILLHNTTVARQAITSEPVAT
ncbi:MAG TPA: hypothetical protein VIP82_22760 [Microbacterium sp.]|uniref:hypothetical protein n=1 Tax=Microbacterium sp. TaxID=51671 RepID=UPI002F95D9EF